MKCIMLMFDTLNRRYLPPYGGRDVHAPNFARLAQRTAVFDRSYVGSMPCMPARRELHTGRYNFLHAGWGPLEPYDDSMPQLLDEAGIHSHLVTDHQHYWEDGGATFHNRYTSYRFVRGQEGDPFHGIVGEAPASLNDALRGRGGMHGDDAKNRLLMPREEDQPMPQTIAHGLEFIRRNATADGDWFLQLETFDPHEPFFAQAHWRALYDRAAEIRDWPPCRGVEEDPAVVDELRDAYRALVSMCDHYLGQLLDLMDSLRLWDDTMLIVNTDHGFLLGEHESWAKCWCPFYQEVAHTPLFIWDPRSGVAGARRESLVQTIDLAPTVLEFFGLDRPEHMLGAPLRETVATDASVRDYALFGIHGGHVNITDGRYIPMRAPDYEAGDFGDYRLMPTHMRARFAPREFDGVERHPGFGFTKGAPVWRFNKGGGRVEGGRHCATNATTCSRIRARSVCSPTPRSRSASRWRCGS